MAITYSQFEELKNKYPNLQVFQVWYLCPQNYEIVEMNVVIKGEKFYQIDALDQYVSSAALSKSNLYLTEEDAINSAVACIDFDISIAQTKLDILKRRQEVLRKMQ